MSFYNLIQNLIVLLSLLIELDDIFRGTVGLPIPNMFGGCLSHIPHGFGFMCYQRSGIKVQIWCTAAHKRQMGRLVNYTGTGFRQHLSWARWHDFTSQSNVRLFTQVASQIREHCNVISPWVAGHIEQGPPSGDREHFISHWHVHLYPRHPAEGCWGCQPWGNERGNLSFLPESKQRENYICDHRAKLVTKSLGSLQLGKLFM